MRPFKILGVQQIAVGGDSKDKLKKFWVDTLGLQNIGSFRSEKENVDEDILQMGKGPYAVEVDIMEPVDPNKSPKVNDPKLNHIGLWVDDIHKAVEWLSAQGVRFTPGGIRKGAGGHDVTFIHPKGNEEFPLCGEGVLVELVQAPKEVIEALG
ncbi:VOC family protein [Leptospira selangorensis]|uniref:VOC family protein n=1 Tax=Leptospira selangorensis TaxID=2484982 RepID=UPI001083698C|nr:VOC family protein [Leptospira selangorensis]TGK06010.1 VOC family protein [Leptospira selangorensis]